ncbi:hypothetical protein HZB74_00335 [Candidatus Saccharibacteria bacterium]|nr:hypothetical protein [Candidatus Saccharibacteria bacterium]
MLITSILTASIAINLLVAFLVIVRNPKSATHRYFFALTIAFISFGLINYISLNPVLLSQITWIRLDLISGVYLFLLLYLTFYVFPEQKQHLPRFAKFFVPYSVFVSALTLTPFVFTHLEVTSKGVQPIPGPGIVLFVSQHILAILMTIWVVAIKYRKSDVAQKKQLKIVISGTMISVITIILFNLVAVQAFHNNSLIPYSSVGVLAFTLSFAFCLFRYRFLDVRLIVVRALAYVMFISSLSIIYVVTVFVLADQLLITESVFTQRIVPIIAAVFLVFTAPFFKRFFDRITNRFFYRDAYEPQILFDELNKVLISNIELSILLRHASQVIQSHLKSDMCVVAVNEGDTLPLRIAGTKDMHFDQNASSVFMEDMKAISSDMIITDELDQHNARLKKILQAVNVSVVVRLRSGSKDSSIFAFLMLGPKRSGNLYGKFDLKIINIIGDSMVIAIQNALRFEEIQQFNVTLQAKVNEATAKLQKTNKKLRDLDETKDEFISMASHQLRTPLTTVKGYMSMVLEGDAGKLTKPQKELLEQAFISSQRMVYLIADLLNVSRLKTGKFVLDLQPTNLAEVVEGEITQLKETANAKGLGFEFKKPKKFPELMLDETKIRQVIMNFSDNAIYYTPSGGNITIELKEDKNSVYFTVKDTGLGVPKDEKSHLFTKFYRAKNARNARPDGTGLGLFMAKKVVDALGGNIIFESEEGKGSTFGFTFEKRKLKADHTEK